MNIDIAEAIKNTNMYELAMKTQKGIPMTDTEDMVVAQLDAKFKEIGKLGYDKDREISAFMTRVLTEELYNTPDELLDLIFDQDTIGANDDFELITEPKNTLVAYDAAQGGNVPKSYLDISAMTPKWKTKQIESEISFADLERNGWKTVARFTEYATQAFKNAMFRDIFSDLDSVIVSGAPNYITVSGDTMTQAAADALALYVNDWAEGEGTIVGYTKYIQQISKLQGFDSEAMKDEIHRTGRLGMYDGVALTPISSVRKQGDGTGLFIDKRVFGVAGKIGRLTMRGEMKVYETENNNKEKIELKACGFTYGWAFESAAAEKVCKVVLGA